MNIQQTTIDCLGYSLAADWYEGNEEDIIVVFPAYTSSKARIKDIVQTLCEDTGCAALVFDYTGHGESPFELRDTRPAQHFLEAITVFDLIKSKYPNARITVFGTSYGSFLATQLTKYREFDRLILRVPGIYRPSAFYDTWAYRLDNTESYNEDILAYRSDEEEVSKHPLFARASSFKGKTLVVVHDDDEVIPKATSNVFIKAFNAESFVEPGFIHNIGDAINEDRVSQEQLSAYKQKYVNWLK
mgnify:CR=1 FL=1